MDHDAAGIEQGERLLAQQSLWWKCVCSAWVLLVAVGFVMFSVLGWAWGALLSRSRRMWLWTLMWGVLYGVAALAMELDGAFEDAGVIVFLVIWVGSIAHAASLSRGVLRARAVALARDRGWRDVPDGPPAQPSGPTMPTIPLPDGVRHLSDDLRDAGPSNPK